MKRREELSSDRINPSALSSNFLDSNNDTIKLNENSFFFLSPSTCAHHARLIKRRISNNFPWTRLFVISWNCFITEESRSNDECLEGESNRGRAHIEEELESFLPTYNNLHNLEQLEFKLVYRTSTTNSFSPIPPLSLFINGWLNGVEEFFISRIKNRYNFWSD